MIRKDGDVESYTEASSPTPAGHENITPTDMVSDAVRDIIDGIQTAFEVHPQEEKK
ncbi:hypothetical protein [Cohnella thermotolerans]|jgi:hypothetical protein|uniref:hypothetical protein n=1 Tax=Cohnella thermotolerans TaxID=329858 RepID=UPI0003F93FA9|nr:hypothetical protein [Cohnella thermotolerans]